ncbi:MAG TPA: cation:proton antiporter [Polyangiales bacterium]|nr:cation:proton antiporter [Polyangiales bacterium]
MLARRLPTLFCFLALALTASRAFALGSDSAGTHADPIAPVLLALAVILIGAKLGGELATRLGQPAVLGELVCGVVLGNLRYLGVSAFEVLKHEPAIDSLARLGVIILLFEVGLESTVGQMMKVGVSSLLVATLGVIAPFVLGWGAGAWLLPEASEYVHMFLGAALTATSVGITARVLKDLGASQSDEARIILGAAVIDDVMGLIVLSVTGGLIAAADRGVDLSGGEVALTLGKAVVFLVGALAMGVKLTPRVFVLAARLQARGVLLALGLSFCFLLAWLASAIGLAPIVGAFAAGLVLEKVHYRDFVSHGETQLEELVQPISSFLVPIFFVSMGLHTDLRSFTEPGAMQLAAALIVCAVAGKQLCGLGVVGKGLDRLSVGIGMIPRGEVGLIFANIGMSMKVGGERIMSTATYSAVVAMVVVTTMITPPALKWSLKRRRVAPLSSP